ncbi:MAG: FkbM family methyltransferase [Xanthobacteraceae bacterium]|nr:FkbM family methyltransferase [Xanthobacteraceae bacterium]
MYNYSHFVAHLRASEVDWLLDVGANVGQFALDIPTHGYGGHIISFEPLRSAHDALQIAAKENPLWEIAPRCAIGAETGSAEINIARNSYSSSLRPMLDAHLAAAPQSGYIGSEMTPVQTLREFLDSRFEKTPPRFALKIDTQGYENEVLDGLGSYIDRCAAILLELPLVALYEGASDLPTVFSRLQKLGFECVGATSGHLHPRTGDAIEIDGLFVRKEMQKKPIEFKIFTSIPPRTDVAQQRRVLDSWRINGFTPVSVNSPKEVDQVLALGLDVQIEVIPTEGKPLIGEILTVIKKGKNQFAGIVNADCRMIRYPHLAHSLQSRLNGSLFYAERLETISDQPTFVAACHGFDGFFFDVSVVKGIKDSSFRMGECWWDYWFPLRLAANGANIGRITQPILLHEQHDPGRPQSAWHKYAEIFWKDFKKWQDALALPNEITSRLDRSTMGQDANAIAMGLYYWLRKQECKNASTLLPPEYQEVESLLHIDNLQFGPGGDSRPTEASVISYSRRIKDLVLSVIRLLSEPAMLTVRLRRGVDLLRSEGAIQLASHILRFGRR